MVKITHMEADIKYYTHNYGIMKYSNLHNYDLLSRNVQHVYKYIGVCVYIAGVDYYCVQNLQILA